MKSNKLSLLRVSPYFAVSLLFIGLLQFIFWPSWEHLVRFGNLCALGGALLTAAGVVLNKEDRSLLYDVKDSGEYAKRLDRVSLIKFIDYDQSLRIGGFSRQFLTSIYERWDRLDDSKPALTEKKIAEILLAASDYTEAGAVLVIFGSVLSVILSR